MVGDATQNGLKVVEQPSERGLAENAKVFAAIRDRLNARSKELLELEKFSPTDRRAVLPNPCPKGVGRHQEGPRRIGSRPSLRPP